MGLRWPGGGAEVAWGWGRGGPYWFAVLLIS